MAKIIDMVKSLSGERIKNLFEQSTSETLAEAQKYFIKNGISYDELACELKDDFRKNIAFQQMTIKMLKISK